MRQSCRCNIPQIFAPQLTRHTIRIAPFSKRPPSPSPALSSCTSRMRHSSRIRVRHLLTCTRRQLTEVSRAARAAENCAAADAALLHIMSPSSCSSSGVLDATISPLANSLPSCLPSKPRTAPLIESNSTLSNKELKSHHHIRQWLPPPIHLMSSASPLPVHLHHLKVAAHPPLHVTVTRHALVKTPSLPPFSVRRLDSRIFSRNSGPDPSPAAAPPSPHIDSSSRPAVSFLNIVYIRFFHALYTSAAAPPYRHPR